MRVGAVLRVWDEGESGGTGENRGERVRIGGMGRFGGKGEGFKGDFRGKKAISETLWPSPSGLENSSGA